MPTRKQRRRREKNFRHEWETVLIDEEGNEVPVDPDELRAERESREADRAKSKPASSTKKQPAARKLREVPPPSWNRAFKRGGTMGVGMLVLFVLFVHSSNSIAIGVFYAIAFVPMTYWIDRAAYRSYQRRLQKAAGGAKKS